MQTNNRLRETMIEVLEYIETFHKYIAPGKGKKPTALFAVADTIRDKARAALAEPIKNCDVGTAEEQSVRMAEFCRAQYKKTDGVRLCSGCRFFELAGTECQFAWAQLPYEEGVAK